MVTTLLASSANTEGIIKLIAAFWCTEPENIALVLTEKSKEYEVHNSKGKVSGFRVIKQKGRYRFEML